LDGKRQEMRKDEIRSDHDKEMNNIMTRKGMRS
jgi:hypothetical protein